MGKGQEIFQALHRKENQVYSMYRLWSNPRVRCWPGETLEARYHDDRDWSEEIDLERLNQVFMPIGSEDQADEEIDQNEIPMVNR